MSLSEEIPFLMYIAAVGTATALSNIIFYWHKWNVGDKG